MLDRKEKKNDKCLLIVDEKNEPVPFSSKYFEPIKNDLMQQTLSSLNIVQMTQHFANFISHAAKVKYLLLCNINKKLKIFRTAKVPQLTLISHVHQIVLGSSLI